MKSLFAPRTLIKFFAAAAALVTVGVSSASAAGIVYDLRATGGTGTTVINNSKTVTVSTVGSTITFSLVAVVSGSNGVTDEGYQSGLISLMSSVPSGSKNIKANFTGQAFGTQFGETGSTLGALQDLNGDGDIDIGGSSSSSASAGGNYFVPRNASGMVTSGAGVTDINVDTKEFVVGTFTLTVTNVADIGSNIATLVNVKYGTLSAGLQAQRAAFRADNATKTFSSAGYTGSLGSDVSLVAVPEPSTFGMVLVGAMGLLGFRRMGFRRA